MGGRYLLLRSGEHGFHTFQVFGEVGAGVVDLSLQDPGTGNLDGMMRGLELFGKKVLPRIRDL